TGHPHIYPLSLHGALPIFMSSTRCGVSAKQLERELGVTYKTAWRMFKQLRSLLAEDEADWPLAGTVEVDEAFWGGKDHWRHANRSEEHTSELQSPDHLVCR